MGKSCFMPDAVVCLRRPHRLGSEADETLDPYQEVEGVTTLPLPPVAPVLFAFLVWRVGQHGVKLIGSWRDKLVSWGCICIRTSESKHEDYKKRANEGGGGEGERSGKGEYLFRFRF